MSHVSDLFIILQRGDLPENNYNCQNIKFHISNDQFNIMNIFLVFVHIHDFLFLCDTDTLVFQNGCAYCLSTLNIPIL